MERYSVACVGPQTAGAAGELPRLSASLLSSRAAQLGAFRQINVLGKKAKWTRHHLSNLRQNVRKYLALNEGFLFYCELSGIYAMLQTFPKARIATISLLET